MSKLVEPCRCGQRADQPPGFRLEEYPHLQAVMDDTITLVGSDLPHRLVCLNCGRARPIFGPVEVKKARR